MTHPSAFVQRPRLHAVPGGKIMLQNAASPRALRARCGRMKHATTCPQGLWQTNSGTGYSVNENRIRRHNDLLVTRSPQGHNCLRMWTNRMLPSNHANNPSAWRPSCSSRRSTCTSLRTWFCFKFRLRLPFMGTMAEMEPSKFTTEETNVPEKLNVRAEVPSPGAQEESANAGAGEQRESCKLTAHTVGEMVTDSEQQAVGTGSVPSASLDTASTTTEAEPLIQPFPDYRGWTQDDREKTQESLSITILGATGDLARNKIFPALFALYNSGFLNKNVGIFGFSRSKMSEQNFRHLIGQNLTCRVDQKEDCSEKMTKFLQIVQYECGQYEGCDAMTRLVSRMKQLEGEGTGNRIFYLSVPYENVPEVARSISANGQSTTGWTRVILEKPFGHNAQSSAAMTDALLSVFSEDQIYRIDQHLGKELMENLTVLRFSNLIFEPLWTRTYIRNVQVILSEDWGVEGRGRYFDELGIIRDIVQSHVLQTIALFAMEPPVSLDGEDVRNEKVKVLKSMRKPNLQDVVLGQYKASVSKDGKSKIPGYLDEPDVPANSLTSTFVAAAFYIDNARWDGVPFLIKAGLGLIKHRVEIRIQFRHVPGNLYRERFGYNLDLATNQLILRIQPDEGVFLKVNNKVPGLGLQLDSSKLNLFYKHKYATEHFPDSYERLILDVIDGDNHLFIRADECQAAWDLLDPILQELEEQKVSPELYPFGGRGPVGAYYLGAKHGVRWADDD